MNWIKTTDQLPPVGCYVLGYLGNRNEPKMLICKLDDGLFFGVDHREEEFFPAYGEDEVTHWTHMPNAPTQEGTE